MIYCSLPKFAKVPIGTLAKTEVTFYIQKYCKIALNFSATFGFSERNFLGEGLAIYWRQLYKSLQAYKLYKFYVMTIVRLRVYLWCEKWELPRTG